MSQDHQKSLPVESGDEDESFPESGPPSEEEPDDHDNDHVQAAPRRRTENHNSGQGPSRSQVCVFNQNCVTETYFKTSIAASGCCNNS